MPDLMSQSKKLTVAGACIALAFVLNQVSLFRMPMGGSITPFSMLFIVLAGYWLGPVYGILAGVSKGLLDTITGAHVVAPFQYVLDYLFAFGLLGLSGFFRKWPFGLHIGYIVGVLGRYLMVFLSGYLFFYMFAPVGQHAAIYSAVYNITYIGPEMVVTLVVISLPSMKHAIDVVTKTVVTHDDYVIMTKNRGGSISPKARLVTGAIMGALGGLAFVLMAHITRLESFSIMQYTTGAGLFAEAPTRIARMIERNTGQIIALRSTGVLFLALGVGLLFSVFIERPSGPHSPSYPQQSEENGHQ